MLDPYIGLKTCFFIHVSIRTKAKFSTYKKGYRVIKKQDPGNEMDLDKGVRSRG
jgi:nitric oxide reductase activation protein